MREKILINHNWRFLANPPTQPIPKTKVAAYLSAKTERLKWGPGSYHHPDVAEAWVFNSEVNTEAWQSVDLPHDYIISQEPDKDENCAYGYLKSFPAWYRKHFTLSPDDEGKRLSLYFEGITGIADLYLNGCFLKHNDNGYVSFEVDITDLARFDQENVLAVYVNPDSCDTWWYEGGGIYRNVWLVKTDPVAVDLWGVFIPAKHEGNNRWLVPVEVAIRNITFEDTPVALDCRLLAPDGTEAGALGFDGIAEARAVTTLKAATQIDSPQLWDIASPKQYTMAVTVTKTINGETVICDKIEQKFGFRQLDWNPQEGFFLNGHPVKLKGCCGHLDYGLTGKAVPNNICRYKAQLLKDMGANAFRTSHYPHQEAFMDACDELGILVMDETRRFETCETSLEAMTMLIKRDRNRPSVILWSTGNEEMTYHTIPQGRNIHKALQFIAHKLDGTRLVTSAMTNLNKAIIEDVMDVIGANYGFQFVDDIHAKYPEKPLVGSENCAVASTRGWYYGDSPNSGMYDARDRRTPPDTWFCGREQTWKFIMARPWYAGTFQWDAFEHRGEAAWPRVCSVSGAIDLFLQKKDAFYQNQSHWLEKPMIHVLPHWNHSGLEGTPINVWVYTNCEEAELFLNGVSLGRRTVEAWTHQEWNVPYTPGRLEAVGYNHQEEVARDMRETTGKPVKLKLQLDNGPVRPNGEDVALFTCIAIDEQGREVPDACPMVTFDCTGFGRIIGTGSSNIDHVPVPSLSRRMFMGRISIAVKMDTLPKGSSSATLMLIAQSSDLNTQSILRLVLE